MICIPSHGKRTLSTSYSSRRQVIGHTGQRLPQDAANREVDYYVTEKESSSVNESERSSERMNDNDVNENEVRPRSASIRDASSPPSESPSRTENENDVTNDSENEKISSKGGVDITVPGISENERNEENPSLYEEI